MLIKQFSAFIHSPKACVSLRGEIIFFMLVYGKRIHSLGFVIMFNKVLFPCESHSGKQVFSEMIKFFSSQSHFLHDILPSFLYMYAMKRDHTPWKS